MVEVESPREDLELMFQTTGWRYVARPALERRVAWLTEQLVTGERLEPERLRELQAQIKVLRLILQHKVEFFMFGLEKETDE